MLLAERDMFFARESWWANDEKVDRVSPKLIGAEISRRDCKRE